jgi:hypothetical protein
LASKTRGVRTGTFLTPTPALSMIEAPSSTLAAAIAWMWARSCCRIATSAVCFSLEAMERWDVLMVVMDLFRSRLESEAIRRSDCLVVQADELLGLEVTVFRE